jgi:hypothetical protein
MEKLERMNRASCERESVCVRMKEGASFPGFSWLGGEYVGVSTKYFVDNYENVRIYLPGMVAAS